MESVFERYRNLIVLAVVLSLQLLGLAVQVRRTTENDSSRLIRVWAVGAVSPFEKGLVWAQNSTRNLWHNYVYLRGVRAENRDLRSQIEQMRIEQVRLTQDADQARRLQALLAFKEQFISQTKAAQVIGSSGSEQSRSIYIDKGEKDGIKTDMAVITADGVVGKVLHAYGSTSLVLLISDQTSGVGAILEKSRLQGIVRGVATGEVVLEKVMSDEQVAVGELILTSGGDRIFPKGMPVGRVTNVLPPKGGDPFLQIQVKPAANLGKLEELLVVTKIDERQATPDQTGPVRASDILAERLPTVPAKPAEAVSTTNAPQTQGPGTAGQTKPVLSKPVVPAAGASPAGGPQARKVDVSSSPRVSSGPGAAPGQTQSEPRKEPTPQTPAGQDAPQ